MFKTDDWVLRRADHRQKPRQMRVTEVDGEDITCAWVDEATGEDQTKVYKAVELEPRSLGLSGLISSAAESVRAQLRRL